MNSTSTVQLHELLLIAIRNHRGAFHDIMFAPIHNFYIPEWDKSALLHQSLYLYLYWLNTNVNSFSRLKQI
jgi:hypothetical protein